MRDHIHDAITNGNPTATKNLVQALVNEVRIIGEHTVQPVFRMPVYDSAQSGNH